MTAGRPGDSREVKMKYGYELSDRAYAHVRIVKAKKAYGCESICTAATPDDVSSGPSGWGAYVRKHSPGCLPINPGDVYVYQFDIVEGDPIGMHCCIHCALEHDVVRRVAEPPGT